MRLVLALFLMLSLVGAARADTKNAAPGTEATYVRAIQGELTKLGYYHGTIDGKPGSRTEEAIRAWQQATGRKVDGIPTAAMAGQMRHGGKPPASAKPAKPTAAPPPAEGEAPAEGPEPAVDGEVAAAQKLMLIEGYFHGAVDGRNGPQTGDAIKLWQENHGMARTGEVDAALLMSLAKSPTGAPEPAATASPAPAKPTKTKAKP